MSHKYTNSGPLYSCIRERIWHAFQSDLPLQMWVYPASSRATLPPVFAAHALTAEAPISVPAAAIEQHRERWITAWMDVVLR